MEQHRVRCADGVDIVLHRAVPKGDGPPVILVPGTFGSRFFWTGRTGRGFHQALAERGHDVWILETRCHGDAEWDPNSTIDVWIREDAPAAIEYIASATGAASLLWVGHSAGGVLGTALLGSGSASAEKLGGIVLLGTPAPGASGIRRLGARVAAVACGLSPRSRLHGRSIGFGGGFEPAGLIAHWMRWNLAERWTGPDGTDYLADLPRLPILAIGGAADLLLAPPNSVKALLAHYPGADIRLIIAGRSDGFRHDFGHAGLVRGDAARDEIWPLIMDWLDQQN